MYQTNWLGHLHLHTWMGWNDCKIDAVIDSEVDR